MLCILYVTAIGTLLGVIGVLVEGALPANTTRRRLVWCSTIALSVLIPPVYRANHTSSVTDLMGGSAIGIVDAAWWQGTLSYNGFIRSAWLVASVMLVVWGVATAARVAVLLHRSRKSRGGQQQTVDGVSVLVTDSIGPATVGVLKSKVVVPRWVLALPGVQRNYVLRHEEEHRRSHDSLLLFVASLTLLLTPWNLALWWQLRRLRLAVEMDCDNRVVSALGNAPAYGELLFRVAEASSRGPRLQPAFLGAGMLETRLKSLVLPATRNKMHALLLPALACILFAIVIAMPHPVVGSEQHNHTTMQPQTP